MIRANLLHLSYNMWRDTEPPPGCPDSERDIHYRPSLRCDHALWRECIGRMSDAGMNMAVIDVGDGVRYESHPEIAIAGAWTVSQLRDELACCRDHGVEPIPKLNFSACHDAWLGECSRKVSTPEYYTVCRDLIEETVRLFDGPRFFHLGMDEETYAHQTRFRYAVVRHADLWWEDLNFLVQRVEDAGSRAWVWSDVLWHCGRDVFSRNMPRTVLQSNWYYDVKFPEHDAPDAVNAFAWLEEMGYQQAPTGSTWSSRENYPLLVAHCARHVSQANLLGFMMADWRPMTDRWRTVHLDAIAVTSAAHRDAVPPADVS